MITLKYCKTEAMVYVSHIDLLRHIERTLRRTALPIAYSKGYNPHMMLNLGATLPVGVGSLAEYVTIETPLDLEAEAFLQAYNRATLPTLRGVAAWQVPKNPNLAGVVRAADYRIGGDIGQEAFALQQIAQRSAYCIAYPTKKDADATRDIAPLLYKVSVQKDALWLRLGAGNDSIKPAPVVQALIAEFGVALNQDDIVRMAQYRATDEGLQDVDDYLGQMAQGVARV